jgi:hypothetical protein
MHNLHFILIKADSAPEAASEAHTLIWDWGDSNNWRCVGGIASEDGSDDLENHEHGRWGLSFLDEEDGKPRQGTYFSRAVAYLHAEMTEPVRLRSAPDSAHPELHSAFGALAGRLRSFDPDHGDSLDLWKIGRDLKHLEARVESRRARALGEDIPQFFEWQFDQTGLTDMTGQSEGARRYLVFLDMHS